MTRPGWERDIEGGVIVFDVAKLDVAKSNRQPRGVAWEDAIADDWVACNARGEPTGEVATGAQPTPVWPAGDVRERLAAHCHDKQWSGWMRYLFGMCLPCGDAGVWIPKEWAERWQRQVDTLYADLSEAEKESDRAEADGILSAIGEQPTADDWREAVRELLGSEFSFFNMLGEHLETRAHDLAAQRSGA